jgi:hypothetical protein
MTIALFFIGEYDNNTEFYICRLLSSLITEQTITFRCTFFETILSQHLENPCPEEIIATEVEKMDTWAYQECFNKCFCSLASLKYNIIVIPYNIKFNDDNFKDLFSNWNTLEQQVCFVPKDIRHILVPEQIPKITIESYNLLRTNVPNEIVFENVGVNYLPNNVDDSIPYKYICIPSIIHVKHSERSVFTSTDRLNQTIRQIKSIREYVENVKIVLLEMSSLTVREMHQLAHIADIIWTFDKDPELQRLANDDPNKNKAEVYVLRKFWENLTDIDNVSHVAKFGGRYCFAADVTDSLFTDKPVMKQIYAKCYNQYVIEPVFYSIPVRDLKNGKILQVFDNMMKVMNVQFTDNERLLHDLYAKHTDIHSPDHLYIQGYTATSGVFRFY